MSDILIRTARHPVLRAASVPAEKSTFECGRHSTGQSAVPAGKALKIAVTGGIGVGKSTVSRILEGFGAKRIDADTLAHQVLAEKATEIADAFSQPEWKKGVNRKKLAQIVFQNPAARRKLEKIIHPEVQRKAQTQLAQLKAGEIGVYDVPLLEKNGRQTEGGTAYEYDLVIVVTAPIEERYRRLAARSAMTPAEVDQRIAAQISDQKRNAIADVVIKNTSTEAELKETLAKQLWPVLLAAVGSGGRQ